MARNDGLFFKLHARTHDGFEVYPLLFVYFLVLCVLRAEPAELNGQLRCEHRLWI